MSYSSFQKILDTFRKISFSERDKGDRFERLIQAYLKTDPRYEPKFSNVWLWNEFPSKKDFGGKDTGIDIVAKTYEGDYWAVQCKFFLEDAIIDKPAVDSFLSLSSKKFMDNLTLKNVGFSHRLWISTTNHWGTNAEEAIRNQNPPVSRINLYELEESPVDWAKLEKGLYGESSRIEKKKPFLHQIKAIEDAHEYFKKAERGKLIMACGTGKTFRSLRIAETETKGKGLILFLVPSIALLSQTLREWSAEASEPINAICICSDSEVSKKKTKIEDSDSYSVVDLALPATTNVKEVIKQFDLFSQSKKKGLTVVFSTYQSIDVISKVQKQLSKEGKQNYSQFDLIICDEAHRTTGVTLADEDSSAFVKVHDSSFLSAKKRLYMTATPRLYSDDTKVKAAQAEAILCSMDDEKLYGKEIYRIGFGEAVEKNLLSDYKVLILTIGEKDIPSSIQKMIASPTSEINFDDASKLIGCINALSKKVLGDADVLKTSDPEPMRKAVAFCQSIKISKKISHAFNQTRDVYFDSLSKELRENLVMVTAHHVDGTMSAPIRDQELSWLRSAYDGGTECRVLTNVRCLSEGVDVPSLDAVLFLSARNSQVDVVQSVGRVMRKSPGKKYGYIIIPVVVPVDVEPDKALDDNERFKVVWTVLNALRAHDDRFNATINKIELNKKKPTQILVGGIDDGGEDKGTEKASSKFAEQLSLQFEKLQGVVFARMVQKVGDKRYWEQWAKDVAQIAERYIERIKRLSAEDDKHKKAFERFLKGLQKNINPSISENDAIEMLAQHIITKPVFEALFEGYSFVRNNAISVSMQKMIDLLEGQSLNKDTETLQKFYDSVKSRASGIDNADGKQKIIIELYDKFFKTAFPKMVEKLGIVYTPIEVVDFIINSVEYALNKEFSRSLTDENIHILDPFTGTGTFITRLLQSGIIKSKDIERKYTQELFANEIVLLAYYIAAINIENAFHDNNNQKEYKPFGGICLTDTFQLGETDESEKLFSEMFPQNSERVLRQKMAPLRVIIGNPPYSAGQKIANDNAKNQSYAKLDARIESTYVANVDVTQKRSLYDSYFKAFRWSTDRLDPVNGGIIAFVSNGAWIDSNSGAGFRKCLQKEFTSIYVFNLRGNQRTSGELSRKEGGKIFGSGSRSSIAITLLIKNTTHSEKSVSIKYCDIGDYLSRDDKLEIIKNYRSISNINMYWQDLYPNVEGDWINQRNSIFESFIPIGDQKEHNVKAYFQTYSNGLKTNRDAWIYNLSKKILSNNISSTVDFYNQQRKEYHKKINTNTKIAVDDFVDYDSKKIAWTLALKNNLVRDQKIVYESNSIVLAYYRPFFKQHAYYNRTLNEVVGTTPKLFPKPGLKNLVICVSGVGVTKDFSVIMTDILPDLELIGKSQCFPLYYYEENHSQVQTLFDNSNGPKSEFIKRDAVSDFILDQARNLYGIKVNKEDIFYYLYGFMHSTEFRKMFANDLKKMLPRIPLVEESKNFWAFSKAGRKLAELHLEYENYKPPKEIKVRGDESKYYNVEKMRFPSKEDKSSIIYNSKITIENIPAEAYEYVVNGKSAIEWIMERYQITTHKESGIKNDPNDWADEVGNPRYILDLLLSIIHVSIETVKIVSGLPKLKFE